MDEFMLTDDKVIEQFAVNQDRLFAGKSSRISTKAAAAAQQFLKKDVLPHFAYEERYIFPGLLRAGLGDEVANDVAEIRKDHRALIKEIKELTALLAKEKLTSEDVVVLREAMRAFGKHLQRHAVKENKLFPSLV